MFIEIELDNGGCTIINTNCIQRVYTQINEEHKILDEKQKVFLADRLIIILTNGEELVKTFYIEEDATPGSTESLSTYNDLIYLLKCKSIGDMEV
jgi:hypothetical protein